MGQGIRSLPVLLNVAEDGLEEAHIGEGILAAGEGLCSVEAAVNEMVCFSCNCSTSSCGSWGVMGVAVRDECSWSAKLETRSWGIADPALR